MTIKLPKTIEDCTPEQLSKWALIAKDEREIERLTDRLEFRVQVVSIFTGVDKETLRNISYQDLNTLFAEIIKVVSSYQQNEPREEIEVNGQKYIFDKEFKHFTTAQAVDLKLIEDPTSNPYDVLAILYIEKGMRYNQTDERKRILNPIDKRIEAFKQGFKGNDYLDVFAFFLSSYTKKKAAIQALQIATLKITMEQTDQMMDETMKIGTFGQA